MHPKAMGQHSAVPTHSFSVYLLSTGNSKLEQDSVFTLLRFCFDVACFVIQWLLVPELVAECAPDPRQPALDG